jgi:hypothetical protein
MIATNTTLKELDISSNNWMGGAYNANPQGDGSGFTQELAVGIKDNGALTKLDISNNNIEQGQTLQQITECCSTKGVELDSHASDEDSSNSSAR